MKLVAAALALTLALASTAALLAGCGGGGTETTSISTTAKAPATKASPEQKPARRSHAEEKVAPKARASAPTDPDPLPNQGTKAVAPGVPTAKGGDNSIQTFGVEAKAAERVRVAAIAQDYLRAVARGGWQVACSHLISFVRRGFTALAASVSAAGGKGCAAGMALSLSETPKSLLRSEAEIRVLSLRIEGPRAFVIYRNAAGKPYNLPLRREDGQWKVGATAGIALVL